MAEGHNPRCAIFNDPPSLRSPQDCDCGFIPPLESQEPADDLQHYMDATARSRERAEKAEAALAQERERVRKAEEERERAERDRNEMRKSAYNEQRRAETAEERVGELEAAIERHHDEVVGACDRLSRAASEGEQ